MRDNDGVCATTPNFPRGNARPAGPPPPSPRRPRQSPRGKRARRVRVPGPQGPLENLSPRCVSAPIPRGTHSAAASGVSGAARLILFQKYKRGTEREEGTRKGCTLIERRSNLTAAKGQDKPEQSHGDETLENPEVPHLNGHARTANGIQVSTGRGRSDYLPHERRTRRALHVVFPPQEWAGGTAKLINPSMRQKATAYEL